MLHVLELTGLFTSGPQGGARGSFMAASQIS